MVNNIRVGIEIEGLYNISKKDVFNFPIGQYRAGRQILRLGWLAERDSSVHTSKRGFKFTGHPIELISPILNGKDNFFKEIDKFINYFSKNGKYKLKDVFYFNDSCGSHVHISIYRKPKYFGKLVNKQLFVKTRQKFEKGIQKSSFPSRIKKQILKNYFRNYSTNYYWDNRNREGLMYERNTEFNFYSEISGKGIEWRSPNMTGIETWEQFKEFWEIVYNCVEVLTIPNLKWKQTENYTVDTKEYKKYFKPMKDSIGVSEQPVQRNAFLTRYQAVQAELEGIGGLHFTESMVARSDSDDEDYDDED